ncbi:MAG: polysaccharide deacetylase family protein [Lachnospiraceae bacterium]|nr:polysaccharide deacetylase family protein [Lachnospiraceae bacterium]
MKIIKINKRNIFYAVIMLLFLIATIKFVSPAAIAVFNAGIAKNEKKLPIYSVDTDEKKLSISFDAAWGADDTDELLRILDENDVKATFFMCGYWVNDFPKEVVKIAMSGHDLANHSSTHPHMSQLSKEEIRKELIDTHNKVFELTGEEMELFRPPFGEYTNSVIETAEELGYYTIQWSIDSLDWKEYGTEREIKQVLNHRNLGNGAIVLFHNDAKYTPAALDAIIKGIKEKGYEIVPLSELIIRESFEINYEGRQMRKSKAST